MHAPRKSGQTCHPGQRCWNGLPPPGHSRPERRCPAWLPEWLRRYLGGPVLGPCPGAPGQTARGVALFGRGQSSRRDLPDLAKPPRRRDPVRIRRSGTRRRSLLTTLPPSSLRRSPTKRAINMARRIVVRRKCSCMGAGTTDGTLLLLTLQTTHSRNEISSISIFALLIEIYVAIVGACRRPENTGVALFSIDGFGYSASKQRMPDTFSANARQL